MSVLLHQEALQDLIRYGTDIQSDLNDIMSAKPQKSRVASTISAKESFSRRISVLTVESKPGTKMRKQLNVVILY